MQASWNFCCLLLCEDALLLSLEEVILEYFPVFLGSSSLHGNLPGYFNKKIPEETKVCSLEVQGNEFAASPPHCPRDLELCHSMISDARATLELHISLLVGENKAQHSPSPCWFLYHLEKEIIISASRHLLDCLCFAVSSLQQILGWLNSPRRTRACECEAAAICLWRASTVWFL